MRTVGEAGGQWYAVWSGLQANATTDGTVQHLYAAKMSSPTHISGHRVRISSPDASWKKGTELDLQEGPEFLSHDSQLFIVYSTRESWLRDYKLGMLHVRDPNVALTDTANIEKSGPVFSGSGTVYGVGHASFTTSLGGKEPWIVYHSKVDTVPGWNRVIRLQKFGWKSDGTPDFGTPVPSSQAIPVPSGECR